MVEPAHQSDVVVYDGQCAFCRHQVDRLRRWDRAGRFEYLARQTPGIEDRFPALAEGDFNTGMRLITRDGGILIGADAVHRIVQQLPRWKYAAWLYRVPGLHQLARLAYAWVAAHRYRLAGSCSEGTCKRDDAMTPVQ
jgi:predicted DCC family thiol-disulfide oxidoreductase YuxK